MDLLSQRSIQVGIHVVGTPNTMSYGHSSSKPEGRGYYIKTLATTRALIATPKQNLMSIQNMALLPMLLTVVHVGLKA